MARSNEDEIIDMTIEERAVRGATRGVGLDRVIEATGSRVSITWTPEMGKPVGKNASPFVSEIGILVRKCIPLQYEKKKSIPDSVYTIIVERLLVR